MKRIHATALAGVALGVVLALVAASAASADPGNHGKGKATGQGNGAKGPAQNYHLSGWRALEGSVCGVPVSGRIHEQQQYTLNSNGMLSFHYIANGKAEGSADGRDVRLLINNLEVDHIYDVVPPGLGYGGPGPIITLQQWVEDNFEIIVELHAQYNERWIEQGKGKVLQNQAKFHVNVNGVQFDTIRFEIACD